MKKIRNHIKVGVIVGAEQQVAGGRTESREKKKYTALDVELVTFGGYVLPVTLSRRYRANAFQLQTVSGIKAKSRSRLQTGFRW